MIYPSATPNLDIPDISYPEFALARCAALGQRPAFIDGPSGRMISHEQLAGGAPRLAAGLARRRFTKGDVFAIYLPNVPEYALALYGVMLAGGTVMPVSPLSTGADLARQLRESNARYLLTVPPLLDGVRTALAGCDLREVFALGHVAGATPFADLLTAGGDAPGPDIDAAQDVALLPCSSGTTGMPKGVMLTHRNLVANAMQINAGPIDWREGEICAGVPPMFHAYGIALYFGAMMQVGGTVISMPRFDLEQFLQVIEKYHATFSPLVPPVALALAKHPAVDKYDLSSLTHLACGAAPLAEAVALAVQERIGVPMQEGYGMTELTGATHIQSIDDPKNSVGRALPGIEWKVVEPATAALLGPGQQGEICIRGPNVMKGYLDNAQATAEAIDKDGWLHTGDLGYADQAGRCCIVDRLKELIKYKGYQVAPVELEALLLSHPQVSDACVIPQADEEAGEVPKAFVVGKGSVTGDELMRFVADHVAQYKRVRAVEFVDALPRSPAGKLLRRVLVERERAKANGIAAAA